ncbi:hypothetical protein [Lusitaniella coriacea]|uniref:hypothetical protein n=1 Tax=Lusitaniella coriacea TaxID=1983105 RepID=UPI003CE87FE5
MLAPLLVNLAIAFSAIYLALYTKEEIVRIIAISIATVSVVLSVIFAPLLIKLLIIAIPLLYEKLNFSKIAESEV